MIEAASACQVPRSARSWVGFLVGVGAGLGVADGEAVADGVALVDADAEADADADVDADAEPADADADADAADVDPVAEVPDAVLDVPLHPTSSVQAAATTRTPADRCAVIPVASPARPPWWGSALPDRR
jgi:hypothetical protein